MTPNYIMLDNVASLAFRQKRSKLAPTSCQASSMFAAGTTAVNVVGLFMALLSFRGFDTPSLPAQGEQRLADRGGGHARIKRRRVQLRVSKRARVIMHILLSH